MTSIDSSLITSDWKHAAPVIDSRTLNPFELNMDNNSGIYETFFNPDSNNNYLNSVNLSCEYYTEQQFNFLPCLSPTHSDQTSFSTIHVNARSLR